MNDPVAAAVINMASTSGTPDLIRQQGVQGQAWPTLRDQIPCVRFCRMRVVESARGGTWAYPTSSTRTRAQMSYPWSSQALQLTYNTRVITVHQGGDEGKKVVTEISGCRIAIWLTSALLLLGAAAGQQSTVTPDQTVPCQPQPATATAPFDTCKYLTLGPGIRPPKAVNTVEPAYPEAARKAKLSGSVVVAMAVNGKGDVDDVKVVRSSNRQFEQNAMDAAKQWKFLPATKDGQPVAVQMNSEMTFKLY